ncbi:MAG: efflux transporter outer membrane subunit [Muribaculaceae bacterium]|nr:efflux transporter outer membrane subunit [Muribaculaceae bacterium]
MRSYLLIIIAFCVALSSAAQTPDLARPLPSSWQYTDGIPQTLPDDDSWWKSFNDPVLDSLITLGVNNNFDLSMAMRRMDAAARQIDAARAAYYPTLGVNAAYTRSRSEGVNANRYSLGATASWEIDLFGKITAGVRQKKAAYRASRAEWTGAMVSLAGNIASTYVQLRQYEAQLKVAEQNTLAQDSIAGLVKARYDAGLGSKPSLEQAQSLMYSTRSTIPSLRTSVAKTRSALALLVGVYPGELEPLLSRGDRLPDYHMVVSAGVPADLLRRRPDIAQAEAEVAAAAAAAGIAKKDYLPSLTIEGNVGVAAGTPGDMFTSHGFNYSVTPTLSWTVFDGLARRANVAAANDELLAQIDNYNYVVMNAYAEVDNALIAYGNTLSQISDAEQARDSAMEFLHLQLDLYTQGLSTFSDVATAQQSVLSYSNNVINARAAALTALIDLYEALGGGFVQ